MARKIKAKDARAEAEVDEVIGLMTDLAMLDGTSTIIVGDAVYNRVKRIDAEGGIYAVMQERERIAERVIEATVAYAVTVCSLEDDISDLALDAACAEQAMAPDGWGFIEAGGSAVEVAA